MPDPKIVLYSTTKNKLSELEKKDGQMIYVTDTQTIYLDLHGLRLPYGIEEIIEGFDPITGLPRIDNPTKGYYMDDTQNVLWRYTPTNGWKQIAYSPFFFGDYNSFPAIGNENILYITEEQGTYRWNGSEYILVSTKQIWKKIQ